ncbi:MAG: histidinol dehydrogenase, partial [Clostridia bacterium]
MRQQTLPDRWDESVRTILDDVRTRGDAAVRAWTERFDGVSLPQYRFRSEACQEALNGLDRNLRAA